MRNAGADRIEADEDNDVNAVGGHVMLPGVDDVDGADDDDDDDDVACGNGGADVDDRSADALLPCRHHETRCSISCARA